MILGKRGRGMAEQFTEIITGDRAVIDSLRPLIDSRVVCNMQILRTNLSWITLLLEIRRNEDEYHLLIDRVAGFETALLKSPEKQVSLEFMDKGGVPSQFQTKVIACHPKEILAELPRAIYRIQRRQYFRIDALLGTEITFMTGSSTERQKAKVKNYSAGGIAFFMEKEFRFGVGDTLTNIDLNIPEGERLISFRIPKALIRRMTSNSPYSGKAICAIEFIEISGQTRNGIISHIFKQERVVIQRIRT